MSESRQLSHNQLMLSTRRSLLADPVSLQVHAWLRRIYVHPPKKLTTTVAHDVFPKMVAVLQSKIETNAKLRDALDSLATFIAAPVPQEYVAAFDNVKRPGSTMLRTFISVVYGRALLILVDSQKDSDATVRELEAFLDGSPEFIEKYSHTAGTLDRNFIGHLVTTAEIEAQLDPYMANALERSGALFPEIHRPAREHNNPFADAGSALHVLNESPKAWWRLPAGVAFAMTVWHQAA